ncbi:uncharacterized protein V6R79_021346 [Siganus canaliculatus]
MSRHSHKSGIPDRWLDYSAVGRRLPGTRFIAFKVPLKQSLNRGLSSADVFGPWELLDALSRDEQQLGLIVDLTFTTRYYSKQDLPESLLAVKIFTAGHKVPNDATILSFKRVVRRFLRDNDDNDRLIGVHCTHGVNRTGYLICRYLIDVDGMDPEEAIDLVNSSRGHAIERQNYLDDLKSGPRRSNEGMDECELELTRGLAAQRPEERRRHHGDAQSHRSQRSHQPGLLPPPLPFPPHAPPPPLLPTPAGAPPLDHTSRWPSWPRPSPDGHWRSRPRFGPGEPEWRTSSSWQDDWRRRSPPPRPPPPPPSFPRYSARWSEEADAHYPPEDVRWAGPKMRRQPRYSHRGTTYDDRCFSN